MGKRRSCPPRTHSSAIRSRRFHLTVQPGFWILLCLMLFLDGSTAAVFLAAAACHELGHLAALRLLRIPVRGLTLSGSGAVLCVDLTGELREIWAVLAGPGMNLLLLLCFRSACPGFALCNLLLAGYNLLPVFPLDGGRLCEMALPRLFGAAGEGICLVLSRLVLAAAVACGVYGTCVLHLGLLPCVAAAGFLLRLGSCQTVRRMI